MNTDVMPMHMQERQLLQFSNQVLQQVAQGHDLVPVLTAICHAIEAIAPDIRCSVLLMDADGLHLHHGAAPSLPVAYAEAIDGLAIGPCVGSCGTAMYRKEAVFSADIQHDPLWANFKALAGLYGLAACWSSPIFSSAGEVLGTFGIYWSSPHPPITALLSRFVETTTFVASIALEKHQRKQHLQQQLQELQRWEALTLNREDRIVALKTEVNALLSQQGQTPRYSSSSITASQLVHNVSMPHDVAHMRAVYLSMLEDQSEIAARLRQAANVFEHTHEGICITDAQGVILNVNRAFIRITGYAKPDVLGQTPSMLASGRHDAAFFRIMWHSLHDTGHWSGEIWNKTKSGYIFPQQLTISAVQDELGRTTSYVGLYADISALKAQEQQLERMAHYDMLTQLPNRLLLSSRIQQAMTDTHEMRTFAVAFLDLDGFKAVNDTHGHESGDALLKALGQRMQQALRSGDTLARIGGDEFVALLHDLPRREACIPVLQRLLQAAATSVRIGEHDLSVSASIGVSFFPPTHKSPIGVDDLLRQADQAMYQAKQTGRNRYHLFDESLAESDVQRDPLIVQAQH